MQGRVVVTGVGVLSTLGDSPLTLHHALCMGQYSLGPIGLFRTDLLDCHQAHELTDFDPQARLGKKNLRALDRTSSLVIASAKIALANSGWSEEMRHEQDVGLILGTMFCSARTIAEFDRRGLVRGPNHVSPMDFANTVINAAAGQTAIWHGLRGINSTIAGGIPSGLQAIAYASDLIRAGQAPAMLAGGADELCFESLCGFEKAGLLSASNNGTETCPIPFDARRNGFSLGEGAALVMLEEADAAIARGASILAEIKGHGTAYDLSRGKQQEPAVASIARAMRTAMQEADLDIDAIDCISASANGSPAMDAYEAQAVATVFGDRIDRLPVTAIKSMLGETLGASGALQTAAFLSTMQTNTLPGIRGLAGCDDRVPLPMMSSHNQQGRFHTGLINAVGLDGPSCALIVAAYE